MIKNLNKSSSLALIQTLNFGICNLSRVGIYLKFWLPGDTISLESNGKNTITILNELKQKIIETLERINNGYLKEHNSNVLRYTLKLFNVDNIDSLLEIAKTVTTLSEMLNLNDNILTELGVSRTNIASSLEKKLNLYCHNILHTYFSEMIALMDNCINSQETGINMISRFTLIYTKYDNEKSGYFHVNLQNAYMEIQEHEEEARLKQTPNQN